VRTLVRLMGIGLLTVACVEPRAAEAGVLLVKGASVRQNILPPLIPLPDGSVIAANDLVRLSWCTNFGDDDVLIVNSRAGTVSRYGDRGGLSLESLASSFSASIRTLDPATLVSTPLARQSMSLAEFLDQPGTLAMVDVGPASVPASTFSLGADDFPVCVGDCNNHGAVTVEDVLTMVNVALGNAPVGDCIAGDPNDDSQITVDEILTAVNSALNGCGG
jgi:hypothetical protein